MEWTGYQFSENGRKFTHSIELSDEKFKEVYEEFKKCLDQKKFYFEYVNPLKQKKLFPHGAYVLLLENEE